MKISREDIHFISRHSNWSEPSIHQRLKDDIYADKAAWEKFIKLFCLSLGATFTTLGIVFFFAYNWADLHKFIKIGLVQGLMIAATLVAVVPSIDWKIRRIVLMMAAALVGVLFAVFGQVYQTGADSYDFFLGWTVFIMIWVLVSNFAPLWLLFLVLINTTFVLYTEQVGQGWRDVDVASVLFMFNAVFVIAAILLKDLGKRAVPEWLIQLGGLAVIMLATQIVCMGIFGKSSSLWWLSLAVTIIIYTLGISYGLINKQLFYVAAIPLSIIIIISAIFISLIDLNVGMFFFISLFIIGSVTWLIKTLLYLQKQWSNG